MTIRRRIEEYEDDRGRYVNAVQEREPVGESDLLTEEHVTSTTVDPWSVTRGWIRVIALWMCVALLAVETILGFRLAFLLAGANANNGFVDFIYDVTGPLAEPFQGIIANEAVNSGTFEPAALIAMLVYVVAAALLMATILVITSGPSSRGERLVTSRTRHRDHMAREHEDRNGGTRL